MTALTQLGKYDLDPTPLGQGAMGVVYRGFDPDLKQAVAIKVIRKELLEGAGAHNARERFKKEAIAGRRLRHPNIVPVYEYGEDGDRSYIVMALIEGRRLKDVLDGGHRFALPETLSVMEQMLEALDYAHRQHVVHRDIKPANLLYSEEGQLQVADFGIARIDASTLTLTGAVLGTPGYMSPEQCRGAPSDHRADVFAAGVILYELLSGERPFRGSSGIAIAHQILNVEPAGPSRLNVEVPPAVDAVVAKAMAKGPDDRFPSARDFLASLEQALAGRRPSAALEMDAAPTIPGTRLEEPTPKTRKAMVAAAGLAATIALGAMAIRVAKEIGLPEARIDGTWQAVVTYDWGATHSESFLFRVDGDEVAGSASFLGTKRGVLGGTFGGDRISFDTRTRETLGDGEKETVHHYRGRISGDEIRFILQTEGGFSDHPPVEFTAKRTP
ncbi:MAG: serine/threonine-protein kinase [Gammaproteobacteria bacterium]